MPLVNLVVALLVKSAYRINQCSRNSDEARGRGSDGPSGGAVRVGASTYPYFMNDLPPTNSVLWALPRGGDISANS